MKERIFYFMNVAGPLFYSKSAGPGAMAPLAPLKPPLTQNKLESKDFDQYRVEKIGSIAKRYKY